MMIIIAVIDLGRYYRESGPLRARWGPGEGRSRGPPDPVPLSADLTSGGGGRGGGGVLSAFGRFNEREGGGGGGAVRFRPI